ncbi:MAG: aldo/keto reductase, partial [Paracoccaceae bacterium]|nr:aldo/keto reductase [Paracoccaceae bacterium]
EMYPVNPISKETAGRSEETLGEWIAKTGRRDDVIIATKITGEGQKAVRDGAEITSATIRDAVAGSLKRLQTDVIDIYQLHWPNRGSFHFRQNWHFNPTKQDTDEIRDHMVDALQELQRQVEAGRIRHIGLSNESTWGTAQWLRLSEEMRLPRVQTIQNEYSLLCRHYDTDLAELTHHENVDLLAFSPMAAGLLTGKYQNGAVPDGSRKSLNPALGGRVTDRVWPAVDAYLAVAQRHGLDPAQMALAWTLTRPFMGSSIFGATTMEQLKTALGAADLVLSEEVMKDISEAHKAHPMPY